MHPSEMCLSSSRLASLFQSSCFLHTTRLSLSFCFSLVLKATLLTKLFFTLPSSPNSHICPRAQTITSLRKCQLFLASFLFSFPWNQSRVAFSIHLSSATQSLLRSLEYVLGAYFFIIIFIKNKNNKKIQAQVKKCTSFACLYQKFHIAWENLQAEP